MPETLISILQDMGLEIEQVPKEDGEQERAEGIYRIMDQERLLFLIDADINSISDIDVYVNKLMDQVTYGGLSVGDESVVEIRGRYSMREVLWDIYGIFVSRVSETCPGIDDEEVYCVQRDHHLMKRYIVQGKSEKEIAEKILFIVRTEEYIDEFLGKLDYGFDENEYCRRMCDSKQAAEYEVQHNVGTYKEIISILQEMNSETFGDEADEDKRDLD